MRATCIPGAATRTSSSASRTSRSFWFLRFATNNSAKASTIYKCRTTTPLSATLRWAFTRTRSQKSLLCGRISFSATRKRFFKTPQLSSEMNEGPKKCVLKSSSRLRTSRSLLDVGLPEFLEKISLPSRILSISSLWTTITCSQFR